MTAESLARSLIQQARDRLDILAFAQQKRAWHIVVREAQECVELALKGLLRAVGLEPPKLHDIGPFLLRHHERILRSHVQLELDRLVTISEWLQKERENAFYGDIDFIPQDHYTEEQAKRAITDATFTVEQAEETLGPDHEE